MSQTPAYTKSKIKTYLFYCNFIMIMMLSRPKQMYVTNLSRLTGDNRTWECTQWRCPLIITGSMNSRWCLSIQRSSWDERKGSKWNECTPVSDPLRTDCQPLNSVLSIMTTHWRLLSVYLVVIVALAPLFDVFVLTLTFYKMYRHTKEMKKLHQESIAQLIVQDGKV